MKKTTDILFGVLSYGIWIGLLAAPIYFLRWYEVIAIHFLCFLISFILSKVVTKRKFKDPQNAYIASLLFGIAGLLGNLFDWKKSVNDEEKEDISNIKFPHKDDVIEETKSEVVLNNELPDYWSNDSNKKNDEKFELNLNFHDKSKIELTSNSPEKEVPLSEFIDDNGIEETLEKIQNNEKEIVISLKISNRNGLLSCKCNKNNLELLDEKRIADYLSQYDFDSVIKADELPRNLKVINPLFWNSIGRAIVSKTESINYLKSLINNDSEYEDIDELIQDYIIEDFSHAYVEEYFEQEKWEAIEISKFCDGCSEFDLISDGMVEGIEHETTIRNKVNTQTKVEKKSLQESQKAERVKSFCTNCRESISAADKFCSICGTKITS